MSRYTESVCRICRREGFKLHLKGERCFTDKCSVDRRNYPPGQHRIRKRKLSDYSMQLREKQKVRYLYGLQEKQFSLFFKRAEQMKGATGINFLALLERRLDNVIYRLGFASSRAEARQMVLHGLFSINKRKVNIPSYVVTKGEIIELRKPNERLKQVFELSGKRERPGWLDVDSKVMQGVVKELPAREDITVPIEEKLIVEYYSR